MPRHVCRSTLYLYTVPASPTTRKHSSHPMSTTWPLDNIFVALYVCAPHGKKSKLGGRRVSSEPSLNPRPKFNDDLAPPYVLLRTPYKHTCSFFTFFRLNPLPIPSAPPVRPVLPPPVLLPPHPLPLTLGRLPPESDLEPLLPVLLSTDGDLGPVTPT